MSRAKSHAAMLSLPSTAWVPATRSVLAIVFSRLNPAGHAGLGEPNREPTATDSKRRRATSSDRICS